MKTIRPLILFAALFSFSASGIYAQGNGQGNSQGQKEERQKQFRKGKNNCERCDRNKCDDPNCEKGKGRKGKGKGQGAGRGKGQGQGQGQGGGNGRGGRN